MPSPAPAPVGCSPTLATNELSLAREAAGKPTFKLGFGQSPFPIPGPIVEELRRHAHEKGYAPVQGLGPLREAVAEYLRTWMHVEADPASVVIGPGSKELLFLLMSALDAEVWVPTPAWVSYVPQARLARLPVKMLPCPPAAHRLLQADVLEAALRSEPARPRTLVLNYPHNPTGGTYSESEMRALAAVIERYGVTVLSDEIYGELHFESAHASLARYAPDHTVVLGGLSKWCGAGGWRLGYAALPKSRQALLGRLTAYASETYSCATVPVQHAATLAFAQREQWSDYLHRARQVCESVALWAQQRLLRSGIACPTPRGGFYVMPDLTHASDWRGRRIASSESLCAQLLEQTGVVTLPGQALGCADDELSMRLALVDFDGGRALAHRPDPKNGGYSEAELRELCPRVVEGIERICDWTRRDG